MKVEALLHNLLKRDILGHVDAYVMVKEVESMILIALEQCMHVLCVVRISHLDINCLIIRCIHINQQKITNQKRKCAKQKDLN